MSDNVEKIVFLDIDGPMIPTSWYLQNNMASLDQDFSPQCVAVLKELIDRSGAKIVFNSTHSRDLYPRGHEKDKYPGLIPQMKKFGFTDDNFHQNIRTNYPNGSDRLDCIEAWLAVNKEITNAKETLWVAFDDALMEHKRAIWVDPDFGLGLPHFNRAATLLNFKPSWILI